MKIIYISLFGLGVLSVLSGCSDTEVVSKPIVDAGNLDVTPTPIDGATESGPSECSEFGSENDQLLNAPTQSVPIKKKVVLPAP